MKALRVLPLLPDGPHRDIKPFVMVADVTNNRFLQKAAGKASGDADDVRRRGVVGTAGPFDAIAAFVLRRIQGLVGGCDHIIQIHLRVRGRHSGADRRPDRLSVDEFMAVGEDATDALPAG